MFACVTSAFACGPTPQKVTKEITIKADAASVWQVLKQFDAIAQWHPDVQTSVPLQKLDDEGESANFRLITLKSGLKLEEKRRETPDVDMKLDYQMSQGDFPVSNYRGVMQVRTGTAVGETIVTWTGRFNNKANTLDAPAGQDNATAIQAMELFYDDGLAGLKSMMEVIGKK
ncbi:MAG: SRPBCC family protein [Methylophilaceae bacterium]|nr:SRPBCC family protein [Methylophilaceae bacterium]